MPLDIYCTTRADNSAAPHVALRFDFLQCFGKTLTYFAARRGLGEISEYADFKIPVPTFRDLVSTLERATAAQHAMHRETLQKLRSLADGAEDDGFIFGVGE